jgi:hypothetical protein
VENLCRCARKIKELKNKNERILGKQVLLGQLLACARIAYRNKLK